MQSRPVMIQERGVIRVLSKFTKHLAARGLSPGTVAVYRDGTDKQLAVVLL